MTFTAFVNILSNWSSVACSLCAESQGNRTSEIKWPSHESERVCGVLHPPRSLGPAPWEEHTQCNDMEGTYVCTYVGTIHVQSVCVGVGWLNNSLVMSPHLTHVCVYVCTYACTLCTYIVGVHVWVWYGCCTYVCICI